VPKFPSIPRLSIIVPVGSDVSAFEDTLVSVLENRPVQCEIIVPHNGGYDDPFDLGDEVRFVIDDDGNFIDLLMAGVRAARGQFVHVLADGLRASASWTDVALQKFERVDAAAVAPVVRSLGDQRIVAAGWRDAAGQLFQAVAAGQTQVNLETATQSCGVYLRASFWRRSVLQSLGDAFLYDGKDIPEAVSEATYVFQKLLQQAGWTTVLAADCDVFLGSDTMAGEEASVERGRRIGAARRHFNRDQAGLNFACYLKAATGSLVRTGTLGQCYGQLRSASYVERLAQRLQPRLVQHRESPTVITVTGSSSSDQLTDRAA